MGLVILVYVGASGPAMRDTEVANILTAVPALIDRFFPLSESMDKSSLHMKAKSQCCLSYGRVVAVSC